MKKFTFLLLLIALISGYCHSQSNVIETRLLEVMEEKNDNELIDVNIILKAEIDIQHLRNCAQKTANKKEKKEVVIRELKAFTKESQKDVLSILKAEEKNNTAAKINCHWLANFINCHISRDLIYTLSEHPDIAIIGYNEEQILVWGDNKKEVEPTRGLTQNITQVNADDVWNLGYTGKDILVAILDTGVNYNHTDIKNNLWDGGEEYPNHGYNTYLDNHDTMDRFDHGTHCAGTICGDGTSGTSTGIAPDATIMIVKTMSDGGSGHATAICAGMEFAIEHQADVLNMSLGITNAQASQREMIRDACVAALEIGVIASVAVGNEGQLSISFPVPNNARTPGTCPPTWQHPDQQVNPGGLSCCVVVGAVNYSNQYEYFSSRGPVTWENTSYGDYPYPSNIGLIRPDVVAPGKEIISLSCNNDSGYASMDGTSMAAPCVAGVMCLMLDKNEELSPSEIGMALETTAIKLSETKSNETGSGRIDALAAIQSIDGDGDVTTQAELNFVSCEPQTINAGEEITLNVTIENIGDAATIGNTIATLSSENQYIEIINNEATLNVINIGETATASFVVKANVMTPDNTDVTFSLNTTNNSLSWDDTFTVSVSNECLPPTNIEYSVEIDSPDSEYNYLINLEWEDIQNAESYNVYLNKEKIAETDENSYVLGYDNDETITINVSSLCSSAQESELSEDVVITLEGSSIEENIVAVDIHPNPIEDKLFISTDDRINKISIYNVVGTVVYENAEYKDYIDLSKLNSGIYIIKINTDKGDIIRRIVKE